MDNISYEELLASLPSFFKNYTRFKLTLKNSPKISLNNFLDLRYVKEDIINCENKTFTGNGAEVLLPSHIVSILFDKITGLRFLYFPNSLKRITIDNAAGLNQSTPMYNLPELPRELLYLKCFDCGLNNIPPLPQTLKLLNCSNNKGISRIPELPGGLMVLKCVNTTITKLPELPEGLIDLNFGGGGLENPMYLPEKFPINLEILNIGSSEFFYNEVYELDVRDKPGGDVVLEPGETLTPQTIDKYLAKKKAESYKFYTNFKNSESFKEFPPNLREIFIEGTNLSSFPIELPDIWNTTETKDFLTEKPNPQITTLSPYPTVQTVNFSIWIQTSRINLLQQKYLPLLQNIKNLLIKHKINREYSLFSYYEEGPKIGLDDLINRLQVENHAGFNAVVMGNKGILTSTPKPKPTDNAANTNARQASQVSLPASLNPQISQYLSSNQELQTNTINNSKGGKYKKSKRLKRSKKKKTKSKRKVDL